MRTSLFPVAERLESRIAPALTAVHPLPDILAGIGKTGARIDLGNVFDTDGTFHSFVVFKTNFDSDPTIARVQGDIVIELFDNEAPLAVQNFLAYVTNANAHGDFDKTFIHRSFDFGAGSGPGKDIIQGGGYEVPSITHIRTGPEVHNEYSDARPNVAGTIAVAKTALGPHTATSEWFINLNDNSSILGGSNNGGYTVFGQIVSGMSVVNAIAAQPTYSFSSAFTDLPLQNYNPDPDNNPATPIPIPAFSQLIQILSAKVSPAINGESDGVTFSLVGITDEASGLATDLVSAKLTGDALSLKYKPGASGVAKVTIMASKAGEDPVLEEFLVTVRPNLVSSIASDSLQPVIVPGDSGLAKVKLTNNAASVLTGTVDVTIYLSELKAGDPSGTLFDTTDVPIGSMLGVNLNLASGKSKTLNIKTSVANELVVNQGRQFRLIAIVDPVGDSTINQLFADDDNALGGAHSLFNAFGTFSTRKNVPMSYVDAEGHAVKFTLTGGGFGQAFIDAAGKIDVQTRDTTAISVLAANVPNGAHTDLRNLFIIQPAQGTAPIASVLLSSVDMNGSLVALGGVKNLMLGDLTPGPEAGARMIKLGAFAGSSSVKGALHFGNVTDYSLESAMPLSALTASSWLNVSTDRESLTAPALGNLSILGNLAADVSVTGANKVAAFKVGGLLTGSTVKIAGDVGSVTLGGMVSSKFFAGVSAVPATVADFNAAARTIASFVIKGAPGAVDLMVDSQVAAAKFGTVRVQSVDEDSGTGDFGFTADAIKSYLRGTGIPIALSAAGEFDRAQHYVVKVL